MKSHGNIITLLLSLVLLTSCGKQSGQSTVSDGSSSTTTTSIGISVKETSLASDDSKEEPSEEETQFLPKHTYWLSTNIDDLATAFPQLNFDSSKWDSSSPYIEVNDNVPFFTNNERFQGKVFETYSDFDDLQRCGTAFANVCKEIMPTEKRGEIGMVKPSGWQTSKYDKEIIPDMYLFNRCHLIAYMLAGENANEKNLITGTRYLNIQGMLPFENKVDDYIKTNPENHVLYRVTPMYKGKDLVAQGVLMEAWSMEDKGKGICFCVWCYNVQPQIVIDYSNGNNHLVLAAEKPEKIEEAAAEDEYTYSYILNENSKKIHRPDCSAIEKIAKDNKTETSRTYDELISQGYTPCGICKPD